MDTLILGLVGALAAQGFTLLLHLADRYLLHAIAQYTAPGLPADGGVLREATGPYWLWLVPVVTTLGGLLSGLLVYSLAPEAEGHGTDAVVAAFHGSGDLRARNVPVKMLASALTIGSGGAAGREGPTAMFSAAIGSIYGRLGKRTDRDRRLLLLIGMAAGLSAIFRSPIGTAVFAVEVLYSEMEFETDALAYTLIAAIVAYTINGIFSGFKPLFFLPQRFDLHSLRAYSWFALLGVTAGGIASVAPAFFYGSRTLFRRIPLPPHIKPALGGLGVGLIALALPQVLAGGYGWVQEAIDGRLAGWLLIALVVAKMVAFCLTIGSGGSGGVFAPSLFVGAMLGGSLAFIVGQPPAAFVIVGMAAYFGAAARVPLATLLMVCEMTGGYDLLVPAGLAVAIAFVLQTILSERLKYPSFYEAQVPRRIDSPAHRPEQLRNALVMLRQADVPLLGPTHRLSLLGLLKAGTTVDLVGHTMSIETVPAGDPRVGQILLAGDFLPSATDAHPIAIIRRERIYVSPFDGHVQVTDQIVTLRPPSGTPAEVAARQGSGSSPSSEVSGTHPPLSAPTGPP